MTVSTEVDHNDYIGNGVTTSFPYTFRIFHKSDLVVQVVDLNENITELILDTDYTVTGAGGYSGGNVMLMTALTNGYQISISRELPVTQETDLRNQGKFFAEVHEDAFDKLTMLIQQVRSSFSLSLRKPSFVANYYDALNNYIRNLRDPSRPQDAATKNYVDNVAKTNIDRTLRVPDNFVEPLPLLSQLEGSVIGIVNGRPVGVPVPSGSAADVLLQLASGEEGKGDSLIGVKQPYTGGVLRNQHEKNKENLSASDFGAALNGSSNDSSAFSSASATGLPVLINGGASVYLDGYQEGEFHSDGEITFTHGSVYTDYNAKITTAAIGKIKSKICRSEAVSIACYGDSTTEGVGSSRWYARTDPSTYNPPTAYPAYLKDFIYQITGNEHVSVFNCGYGGQSVSDSWAFDYYEPTVINVFGIPDVVMLGFGLNDIQKTDYSPDIFFNEFERLVKKIIAYGSVPIILTSNPVWLVRKGLLNNYDITTSICSIQKHIAKKYSLICIDANLECEKWLMKNNESLGKWMSVEQDGVHFTDSGYGFIASVIAKELVESIVDSSVGDIPPWMGICSSGASGLGNFTGSNNKFGGNLIWSESDVTPLSSMCTIWVWSDTSENVLRYRSISNGGVSDKSNAPSVKVTAVGYSYSIIADEPLINSGMGFSGDSVPSEQCQIIGVLAYGLNKIEVIPKQSTSMFLGYFNVSNIPVNGVSIKNAGFFPATGGPFFIKEMSLSSGLIESGFGAGIAKTNLFGEINLPIGSGFIINQCNAYYESTSDRNTGSSPEVEGYQTGIILYRDTGDILLVRPVQWKRSTGEIYFGESKASAENFIQNGEQLWYIELSTEPSGYRLSVRVGANSTSFDYPYGSEIGSIGGVHGAILNGLPNSSFISVSLTKVS
ncbi:hypothetical protein HV201_07150 [Citrobacter freundii]|uniref:SGNH/GDSL hydrolase family protein n=1 Tax=Citrobacter freundii TaxID=546 RepID=UPI0015E96D73|nr:SGNH/GDSL hydrolase family protein [Citrobacter freundii]MDU4235289.1 GDSL-type esterase/lipase family protein [Citrobacter freundii]QLX04301.1 hypothetical protein HV201_07150 [Citrobacter freundii]